MFTGKLLQSMGHVYATLFWKEQLLARSSYLQPLAVGARVDNTLLSMKFSFLFKKKITIQV